MDENANFYDIHILCRNDPQNMWPGIKWQRLVPGKIICHIKHKTGLALNVYCVQHKTNKSQ